MNYHVNGTKLKEYAIIELQSWLVKECTSHGLSESNKRFILEAIFGLAILGSIVTGAVFYFIFEKQARLKNRQDELQTELTKLRNKVAAESIINNHPATEIRGELKEISKTLLNLEISEWFLSEHKQAL